MKAKQIRSNYYNGLYESLQNLRRNEKAMAELCILGYEDVYQCSGCDQPILDNAHSFISPDGRHWHNRDCAAGEELTNGD